MKRFRSGIFWGGLIGGIVTLLNAPASGKETRQQLKYFIDNTTEDVNDLRYKVDHLRLAIQKLTHEGIASVQEATEDIQTSITRFQHEAQPRINRVQERVQILQDSINSINFDDSSN